jgi:hypothetical protein
MDRDPKPVAVPASKDATGFPETSLPVVDEPGPDEDAPVVEPPPPPLVEPVVLAPPVEEPCRPPEVPPCELAPVESTGTREAPRVEQAVPDAMTMTDTACMAIVRRIRKA